VAPPAHIDMVAIVGCRARDDRGSAIKSAAVHRANLVAERVPQIGEIDLPCRALSPTRRILDALASVRDAGIMEGLDLLRAVTGEADGAAVGVGRHLTVDRFGNSKYSTLGAIKDAALRITSTLWDANGAEHSIVKPFRRNYIVGPDHDVREHVSFPFVLAT